MKTIVKRLFAEMFLLILLALVLHSSGYAQDTINYRNGEQLAVKVTEVLPKTVKYKKFENPDGPSYTDLKNDIASVRYTNGSIEVFEYEAPAAPVITTSGPVAAPASNYYRMEPFGKTKFLYGNRIIGNHEMHNILLSVNNPRITTLILTAKKQEKGQYIGFLALPLGMVSAVVASDAGGGGLNDERLGALVIGGLGVACFTTSITLKVKRTQNEKAALRLYQDLYR